MSFLTIVLSAVFVAECAELGIPEFFPVQQESALKQEQNLRSKSYQDFIHTLYRFDNDNLKKVDSLFSTVDTVDRADYSSNWQDFDSPEVQLVPGPEVVAPEIPEIHSNRQKRDVAFRPLFVYRELQHEQEARRKRHHPHNAEVVPAEDLPEDVYYNF